MDGFVIVESAVELLENTGVERHMPCHVVCLFSATLAVEAKHTERVTLSTHPSLISDPDIEATISDIQEANLWMDSMGKPPHKVFSDHAYPCTIIKW